MKPIFVMLLSIFFSQMSFADDFNQWAKQAKPSAAAEQKAAEIKNKSDQILKNEKLCENAREKYVGLLALEEDGKEFDRVSRETLYGPTNEYDEGKGPCGSTWYSDNPVLAGWDVIQAIYRSDKILEKDKSMCLAKWVDYLAIWSSYKVNVTNHLWNLEKCGE